MSLAVRGLTISIGAREIVCDLSFDVGAGRLCFIVGPNGAGKTTALRAIGGLVPSRGEVVIAGEDVSSCPAHARARLLGYVPQGHVAHWPIPAYDVVAIGRRPRASSLATLGPADRAAIDGALAAVDAAHLSTRPITELSGGERARIMLARALAADTPLILADEPIAALDPRHQLAVAGLLRSLAHQGRTIVAVVHDLALAARFGDQVVVMAGGRVAAAGSPDAILTDDLIERVFAIRVARFKHDVGNGLLAWSTIDGADGTTRGASSPD